MSSIRKEPNAGRTASPAWRRRFWLPLITMVLAIWVTMQVAHLEIAWRSHATPGLTVFRLRGDHVVALVSQRWLVINAAEKSVVSASLPPILFEIAGLALTRGDRLRGVPLGDGVKGYPGESWAFERDGVDVTLLEPTAHKVHIPLHGDR